MKKDPTSSLVYRDDIAKRKEFAVADCQDEILFTTRQKIVLVVFAVGLCLVVWGLVTQGWYMNEIAATFFAMGLVSGLIGGMSEFEIAEAFIKGMGEFVFAAIIVGFARSILVIAQGGMIIDTILQAMADALAGVSPLFFALLLVVVLALLTFLVPSSSGLAALTMPIFGPLTIMMGLNPEGAVTALVMAEGLACLIIPTNGSMMASLGLCKIPFGTWVKVAWKFMIPMTIFTVGFTIVSTMLPV